MDEARREARRGVTGPAPMPEAGTWPPRRRAVGHDAAANDPDPNAPDGPEANDDRTRAGWTRASGKAARSRARLRGSRPFPPPPTARRGALEQADPAHRSTIRPPWSHDAAAQAPVEPPVEEPPVEEPPAPGRPPLEQPPLEQPPAVEPPLEEPPAVEPPPDAPPDGEPREAPPTELPDAPPTEAPPFEDPPPAEEPPLEAPPFEEPVEPPPTEDGVRCDGAVGGRPDPAGWRRAGGPRAPVSTARRTHARPGAVT